MQLLYSGQSDVVLLLKAPEFYCQSVKPGESLDVSDALGQAILAKHGAMFSVAQAKKRKVDVVEKQVKLRRKVK